MNSKAKAKRRADFKRRFKKVAYTKRWAVTMTKVRIRQAVAEKPFPYWHLLVFSGPKRSEARGVVDLIAIRKDHGPPRRGTKRGDDFQIILIQVKGGYAAMPTAEDAKRLRLVARHHRARRVLLAVWIKGKAAQFFYLRRNLNGWLKVDDLKTIFG
ncbi:MAG: hypothetical protein ABR953_11325 [Candidatus Acidiferrales bacterium]|jgi:hypothetical protein